MVHFETKAELNTALLYSFTVQTTQLSNLLLAVLQTVDYFCNY